MLEYGFHALRDEKKRRYVYFRDSFQANNSNTSPALPPSSQSAFASPGVQSQPSGTYGGPQRAGSQQPGGEAATVSRAAISCTASLSHESFACDVGVHGTCSVQQRPRCAVLQPSLPDSAALPVHA